MQHTPSSPRRLSPPRDDPPASAGPAAAPSTELSPFAAPAVSGLQGAFTPVRAGSDSVRRRKSASCSAPPGNPSAAAPPVVEVVVGRAGGVVVLVAVQSCALSPKALSSNTSTAYLGAVAGRWWRGSATAAAAWAMTERSRGVVDCAFTCAP